MSERDVREPSDHVARNLIGSAAIIALIIGATGLQVCSGTRPEQPEARCEALLDRFVELRERAANPKASPGDVERRKSEARANTERDQALESCQRGLTEDTLACAEAAVNINQLEQCFP